MPLATRDRTRRIRSARRPRLEALEARSLLTTYTMPLVNATNLDASRFSIYVDGFSKGSGLSLQPSGTPGVLEFAPQAGTVASYEVGAGAGEYGSIRFDSSRAIVGGRIYFFVVPAGQAPPSFPFGQQPTNPPNFPYVYQYVEYTQPAGGGLPIVDIPTVDAYGFPVTLTLNSGLGQVGQPLSAAGSRAAILAQYKAWASAPGRTMYRALMLPASARADGQSEGLLNPYTYVIATGPDTSLPANVASPINRTFDRALATLFSRSGWSLRGSDGAVYTATAGTYQYNTYTNPATGKPVKLAGVQLSSPTGSFRVFSPLGVNTFRGANGKAVLGSSGASLNQVVLTNPPAVGVLKPGMYVFGRFFAQAGGSATNSITALSRDRTGKVTVTLKDALPFAINGEQLVFSALPTLSTMQLTSGAMVYGGAGFFADAAQQGYTGDRLVTLGNLENQINAALNRGVAVAPGALAASTDGSTSRYWGTETNWYPSGQPQNLFSLFMHTATVDGAPVFVRPSSPASTKGGLPMAQAYGFAFDEDPGPVPPAPSGQPHVPAKFETVPAGTTTITVTLGSWA